DYDGDGKYDPATIHAWGDYVVWCVLRSRDGYRGTSYQLSTGLWR
ncbi:MAG: hypothetical protein HY343_12080, partial [Lentisphaerae bacterium]|nr:hypothetical protein [Lentisphaerota bacterium]